jgi:histidyl-tRNA synthetase
MILLLQAAGHTATDTPDAYFVHVGEPAAKLAQSVAEKLRDAGLTIVVNAGGGSFKSQMKRADASGARYALIAGDDEVVANRVGLKPLRAPGEQVAMPPAELAARLHVTH